MTKIKMKKFKAAVIGCGNIGAAAGNYNKAVQPATHAGAYLANKKTELVALVENNKEHWPCLEKTWRNIKIYPSAEAMFKDISPDIVSIAASTGAHYELVMTAARNSCPVILCEKPIAYDLKQAQAMIEICRKNKAQLFINHMRHFDPLLQKWCAKIKGGLLGQIYQGNIYYYNGLFNNGTHLIDLLRMCLGDPVTVRAKYNLETSSNQEDLNTDGELIFAGGARIVLQSLSKNYGHFEMRLFGEKGMANFTNLLYEVIYRRKTANKYFKGFFELVSPGSKEGSPRSFMVSSINHVVSFLENKVKPVSSGEDGLAVLKILLALKQSADSGGKVVKL
ncbi:MAG: hypothetical protein UU87_C0002G0081 [Parcubacteria group bacterium GW2011_GWA2_42_11]|nr:MAG: hypothetical protein UU87_C0002G0081 [Parcubacteria group bacterium GW2011_GWA2_42_11]